MQVWQRVEQKRVSVAMLVGLVHQILHLNLLPAALVAAMSHAWGPQADLAEAILAAGSNALHLHDKPQGQPAAEPLGPPAGHGSNQPHEPASEIF